MSLFAPSTNGAASAVEPNERAIGSKSFIGR